MSQLEKSYSIRYGRNYKIVLAIVLPGLLTLPFIFFLRMFPPLEEWKVWTGIYTFLGLIGFLTIWLVLKIYPKTLLTINKNEISLSFDANNILSPSDFSFRIEDINSIKLKKIGNAEYFVIETSNPKRKFQISPTSNDVDDFLLFNEAISEISEMVNNRT